MSFSSQQLPILLQNMLEVFFPLAYAVLGCALVQRVQFFNLGIEASLVGGSLFFSLTLAGTGSVSAGVASALFFGAVVGVALWMICIVGGVDEVVAGVALNMLVMGLTVSAVLYFVDQRIVSLFDHLYDTSTIDRLIPFIAAVAAVAWALEHLRFSNWLDAIGESKISALHADIPVARTLLVAIIASNCLGAAAGVALAVSEKGFGTTQWSLGLGFIALGLVFAAGGRLVPALAGAALYAGLEAVEPMLKGGRPAAAYIVEALPILGVLIWFAGVGIIRIRGRKVKVK